MWGAIAGAAASMITQLAGSIAASKQAGKAKAILDAQKKQNEDWYNRRFNEDYTQTAEAQRAITLAREEAQRQLAAARGRQAVMGGTEESVAATQEAVNKGLADTMSQIAAQGTARKDAIEATYLQTKDSLAKKYIDMYNQRAQQVAQAASNAAQSFSQAGNSFGSQFSSYSSK